MAGHAWSIDGKQAGVQALREALALERQSRKKRSALDYERRAEERNSRKVGAAIRKQARETQRTVCSLKVRPKPRSGGRSGNRRCVRFEIMTGLVVRGRSHVGRDGFSSFHFKWTGRGLGQRRSQGSRRYRQGEAARHVQYILRELARELSQGGLISNISQDPATLAAVFSAIEELEGHGRANANVYISIVISLPHELTAEQREGLLGEICGIFGRDDLPHVGVLHAPDERGDNRNTHAHVMLSLRPFRAEPDGSFSFAPGTCADMNDKAYITAVRQEIADLTNAAMAKAGHARRFTAKSNKDRGLPPRTKRDGKSTPSRKHYERRMDDTDLMRAEHDFRKERVDALGALQLELIQTVAAPVLDRAAVIAKLSADIAKAQPAAGTAKPAPVQPPAPSPVAASQPRPPFPAPIISAQPTVSPAERAMITPRPVAPAMPPVSDHEVQRLVMHLNDRIWAPLVREAGVVRVAVEPGSPLNPLAQLHDDPRVQPALQAEWGSAVQRLQMRLTEADAFERTPSGWALNLGKIGTELKKFLGINRKDDVILAALEQGRRAVAQTEEREQALRRKETKKLKDLRESVATAVEKICGPAASGKVSEADRASIRSAVRDLEEPLSAGLLSLHHSKGEIVAVSNRPALAAAAEKLGQSRIGWQALRFLADATRGLLPDDQGLHHRSFRMPAPEAGNGPAISPAGAGKENVRG